MTRPFPVRSDTSDLKFSGDKFASSVTSAERLRRWAELIASGEASPPADLEPEELRTVLRAVGRLRRERLVRLIARALVGDLHRSREP